MDKGPRQLHNNQQVNINWFYPEIEKAEKEKKQEANGQKSQIEATRKELVTTKLKQMQDLRARLEWK